MKLVATMDFHLGVGAQEEVPHAGDEFTPRGTGVMNVADHARSLVAQGVALPADDKRAAARIARFKAMDTWFRGTTK